MKDGHMYDYLIVGAGLFGSIFAYEATKRGKKVLVIDKKPYWRKHLYRECQWHQCTQIWRPYFSHQQQRCLELHTAICRI